MYTRVPSSPGSTGSSTHEPAHLRCPFAEAAPLPRHDIGELDELLAERVGVIGRQPAVRDGDELEGAVLERQGKQQHRRPLYPLGIAAASSGESSASGSSRSSSCRRGILSLARSSSVLAWRSCLARLRSHEPRTSLTGARPSSVAGFIRSNSFSASW